MYFHQNLRVQLQLRRNRLYKATSQTYQAELKFVLAFIDRTPYLRALVEEMASRHPEIDWPTWKESHFRRHAVELPDEDEAARAKVCLGVIRECAEQGNARDYAFLVSYESNFTAMLRDFTELLIDPFIDYLHDRIDDGNNVLYVLEKYKRRTEWFHRDELLASLQNDSRRSEQTVDVHLREFLFDQGIDYPFSTPSSPSGEADVVAHAGEDQPLVLEIKLFDPERGYDRGYLRQGIRQIYDYTSDYGQTTGYLVVFNCTPRPLAFETKTPAGEWPRGLRLINGPFSSWSLN